MDCPGHPPPTRGCEQPQCCQANLLGLPPKGWLGHKALRASHQTPMSVPVEETSLRTLFTEEMLTSPPTWQLSSSLNPQGFANCGETAVGKIVCLQSNLALEQGSREAVGSLSLGYLQLA